MSPLQILRKAENRKSGMRSIGREGRERRGAEKKRN
jgi:hypothetical protein